MRVIRTSGPMALVLAALAPLPGQAGASEPACGDGYVAERRIDAGRQIIEHSPVDAQKSPEDRVANVAAFCIAETELSVAQYLPCVEAGICAGLRGVQTDPNLPVRAITFDEVTLFLDWLATTEGIAYRLPSEAEWQQAAGAGRGATVTPAAAPDTSDGPVPVDRAAPDAVGLRGMIGNVAEYVSGCGVMGLMEFRAGAEFCDRRGSYRIAKGGHHAAFDFMLNPLKRIRIARDRASPHIGVRLARDLPPGT